MNNYDTLLSRPVLNISVVKQSIWPKHYKTSASFEERDYGASGYTVDSAAAICYKLKAAEVCGHKRIRPTTN